MVAKSNKLVDLVPLVSAVEERDWEADGAEVGGGERVSDADEE